MRKGKQKTTRVRTRLSEHKETSDEGSDTNVGDGDLLAEGEGTVVALQERLDLSDAGEQGGDLVVLALEEDSSEGSPDDLVEALYFGVMGSLVSRWSRRRERVVRRTDKVSSFRAEDGSLGEDALVRV